VTLHSDTDWCEWASLYTLCPKDPSGLLYMSISMKEKWLLDSSLHCELNVGMDVDEKVLQLFQSIVLDHKCVIHVMEPTCGLEGCP
jgi:hypothetical protein